MSPRVCFWRSLIRIVLRETVPRMVDSCSPMGGAPPSIRRAHSRARRIWRLRRGKALRQWRERVRFLRRHEGEEWPDLSDAGLAATAADWLAPALDGKTALAELESETLSEAMHSMLPWNLRRRLDAEAPTHF